MESVEALEVSPYLVIGEDSYIKPDGNIVVPIFNAALAQLVMVHPKIAEALFSKDALIDSLSPEVKKLLNETLLVSRNAEDVRNDYLQSLPWKTQNTPRRTFVLLPTSYCNMGCGYCGQEHSRGGYSPNHRESIIRRINRAASDDTVRTIDVRWFGGEPLMAFSSILQMSEEIISNVEDAGKNYESNIVTNGALLDERKLWQLVHECKITTFHITLDGPAEIHDSHRPLKSGGKSFERLTAMLADVVDKPEYAHVSFRFRTNVDVKNDYYVSNYLKEMSERGFSNRENVWFHLIAVHPWGNDVSHLELSHREFADKEANWLKEMLNLGLNTQLLPTSIKQIACAAVTRSSEVINTDGNIFSCTEQPLVPVHRSSGILVNISNLQMDELRPLGQFDSWPNQVQNLEVPCSNCALLPVCGGNCPKTWGEGGIACPSMKLNIQKRIDLATQKLGYVKIKTAGEDVAIRNPLTSESDLARNLRS